MSSFQKDQMLDPGERRGAVLHVSLFALAELLQLPKNAKIEAFTHDIDCPDLLKIRISGAGWPVTDGAVIPSTKGIVNRVVSHSVDWQIPN